MNNKLFITGIKLDRDKIENYNKYPFNIEVVKLLNEIRFNKPVTFFIGENGIGKSTLIEAIAVNLGLNAEGGSNNFNFSTNATHSILHKYLTVLKFDHPKTRFFLRSESFYNVASEIERINNEGDGHLFNAYGGNLHECSHGEAFIKLVQNRFTDHGLYILDEPESALSIQRQMGLLCLIDDLVKRGSQFIIATHSPVLISYRDGEIINLDDNFQVVSYKDTDIYKTYKMYLDNPEGMQEKMFD